MLEKKVPIIERTIRSLIVCLVLAFFAQAVQADLVTSDSWNWTYLGGTAGYSPDQTAVDQLSLAVTDADWGGFDVGDDQVLFIFSKTGAYNASLTDIFFDDGALLGIAQVYNLTSGVQFASPSNQDNLPAGNEATPPFVASVGFSADSTTANWGVDVSGESVGILFDIGSNTLADVITAMNAGFELGPGDNPDSPIDTLRIGIHVTSIGANDISQSFILTPLPGGVILCILGLGAVGWKLRKFA